MKTRLLTVVVLTMAFVLPSILAAQGPGVGAGPMMMHQRIMDELKLTDTQKKDIETIHSDAMKEQIGRFADIAKARVELHDLVRADNPNQAEIEKKIAEISQLRTQAASKRLANWFTINKMLTPEQQKIWKKVLEQHAAMGNGMGMRGRSGMRGRMGMRGQGMNGMNSMGGSMWHNGPRPR